MPACWDMTLNVAVMAITALLLTSVSDAEKVFSCCKEVSKKEITTPITGYHLQKWDPPCVKAVVFETEGQKICSYWKEPWVYKKILQFKKAQRQKQTSLPPSPQYSSPTASPHLYTTLLSFTSQS